VNRELSMVEKSDEDDESLDAPRDDGSSVEARPFLSADEVRSVRLETVRRHGVDPVGVDAVIERAAVTIETLLKVIDRVQAERRELADQVQGASSSAGAASRLLAAATRTAEDLVADAQREAATILESAEETLVRLRAEMDELSKRVVDERARCAAEIEDVRDAHAVAIDAAKAAREAAVAASAAALDDELARLERAHEARKQALTEALAYWQGSVDTAREAVLTRWMEASAWLTHELGGTGDLLGADALGSGVSLSLGSGASAGLTHEHVDVDDAIEVASTEAEGAEYVESIDAEVVDHSPWRAPIGDADQADDEV
jgi:cell division septum initiation protein DivIVA